MIEDEISNEDWGEGGLIPKPIIVLLIAGVVIFVQLIIAFLVAIGLCPEYFL